MDNLNRLLRQFKPMIWRLIFKLHGFKFYQYGGGEGDPPADPPPADPPPSDPPPSDPPPPPDPNANAFFDGLSEENRGVNKDNVATLSKFKTADDLAKSYIELETKVGAKGVLVPGPDATPEAKEKYYNDLGRPATPGEYKLEAVEGMHESIKVTEETTSHFNGEMHKIGLTNEQANSVNAMQMNFVNDAIKAQDAAELKASQDAETALRGEWKENYDVNKASVVRLITKTGGQEALDAMGGVDGIGNNPVVLKTLGVIAGMLSEDQVNNLKNVNAPSGGDETVDQAKARIKEIESPDSEDYKALNDQNHKDHKKIVDERTRLYGKAYPMVGA